MNRNKKRILIFAIVTAASLLVGYRIQEIRKEGVRTVNNIVRIHAEKGVPREYFVAEKATDFLFEPLYVQNGRALVSTTRVGKFDVGQKVHGNGAKITFVANDIDLDSGMYVVRFSKKFTGTVLVERQYTGFFLPLDAEIPKDAKIIAKDNKRVVVTGLADGDKVVVR